MNNYLIPVAYLDDKNSVNVITVIQAKNSFEAVVNAVKSVFPEDQKKYREDDCEKEYVKVLKGKGDYKNLQLLDVNNDLLKLSSETAYKHNLWLNSLTALYITKKLKQNIVIGTPKVLTKVDWIKDIHGYTNNIDCLLNK